MRRNRALPFQSGLIVGFCLLALTASPQQVPQLGKDSIPEVIAAMTLEEKAQLLVGTGMSLGPPRPGDKPQLVAGAAGTTAGIERLGIPPIVLADGPAGLRISPTRAGEERTYYATAFPIATLLASSWDTDLVERVGQAMGNELREYGVDILLAPALNLHRNPLCGRNFEYFSEDPLISGKMAAALANGVESQGVGTSLKHFAANNQETNRNALDEFISQRALRELYLEGFRIAVQEAQPWTVMSAYNKINGTFASESHDLLSKVLREDWGFEGFVMTDWFGGSDAVAQMKAGNDLLMPGLPLQRAAILKAVQEGQLDEGVLDRNLERILKVVVQTPRFKGSSYSNQPDLKAHAQLTRQAGAEGMVLLKNEKEALPLSESTKKLALFGNASYDTIIGGTGSGDVNEAYSVSLADGMRQAGYSLDESLAEPYVSYIAAEKEKQPPPRNFFDVPPPIPLMPLEQQQIGQAAQQADAAILTIGRNSGEGGDREESDFVLSEAEKGLLDSVSKAFQEQGKRVIVVLNVGGVIETASWKERPDAILLAWQPGQEAGHSISDVLSGKVNPSGRLASTFPMAYQDVPSAKNFPGKELPEDESVRRQRRPFQGNPSQVSYQEDIYVGYRYYLTFDKPTSYEFGFGLSYTEFQYTTLTLGSLQADGNRTVTVQVKNTGKRPGREVVQLYVNAPQGKLKKPSRELVAFAKTGLIAPGESEDVSLKFSLRDLASFDEESSSWIAEAGAYEVLAGASSQQIRQSAYFRIGETRTVQTVSRSLAPQRTIERLKP